MEKSELTIFYNIIQTKLDLNREIKKFYGEKLAPEFNSFNFWSINENKVSEILAFLLNPNENHSQGNVFLKIFLKNFKLELPNLINSNNITVETEHITDKNRRIDILLNFENTFVIGIENKIYETTIDQHKQIEHYSEYLNTFFNGNYLLFYLSPKNKELSEISISKEKRENLIRNKKLKLINYDEHIIPYLKQISLITQSDRVKSFILDFKKTLSKIYKGEKIMNENKLIIDYATKDINNLETTLKIGQTISEIKQKLKDKFYQNCRRIANDYNVDYVEKDTYDWCWFTPNNWKNHDLTFYFDNRNLIYGIRRKKWNKDKTRNIDLENILGGGKWKVSNWLQCERELYENFENGIQGWIDIENGVLEKKIRKIVDEIFNNEKLMKLDL